MKVISTTFDYKGSPVKIENGKVYLRALGTTINNKSMHYSWCKVDVENLLPDLKREIEKL